MIRRYLKAIGAGIWTVFGIALNVIAAVTAAVLFVGICVVVATFIAHVNRSGLGGLISGILVALLLCGAVLGIAREYMRHIGKGPLT